MTPKHFRIVHRLRRRLRVLAPALEKEQERCYILEILLRKHPAIKEVRIVADIGSLVVEYDPAALPEERLLATLDAVLGNLIAAPKAAPVAVAPVDGPLQECSLAIEGMSCASCALLIEMKLKRDPRVRYASVNFAAETVTVNGVIDREAVSKVVGALGYTTRPMDTLAQRRLIVEREKERVEEAKKRFIQAAILTVPVMISGMAMHRLPALRVMEFALSSAILFGSSNSIFRKAWMLAKQGQHSRRVPDASPRLFRVGGRHLHLRPARPLHGRTRQGQGRRSDPQTHRTAAGNGAAHRGRRHRIRSIH
ncbi:MAG: Cu2+-exporting ATPase [Rhodocyclaceae bacterium]|nr:MAG: Cu2+-exporting ATPase [Rhodocyclaceae bacterium]